MYLCKLQNFVSKTFDKYAMKEFKLKNDIQVDECRFFIEK